MVDEPAPAARAERTAAALFRLHERFGAAPGSHERLLNPYVTSPVDAVRLVTCLGGGSIPGLDGEPPVETADLDAGLTLISQVRADIDDLELGLLTMARSRGSTWPELASATGLGSPQAVQQRADRLRRRLED